MSQIASSETSSWCFVKDKLEASFSKERHNFASPKIRCCRAFRVSTGGAARSHATEVTKGARQAWRSSAALARYRLRATALAGLAGNMLGQSCSQDNVLLSSRPNHENLHETYSAACLHECSTHICCANLTTNSNKQTNSVPSACEIHGWRRAKLIILIKRCISKQEAYVK